MTINRATSPLEHLVTGLCFCALLAVLASMFHITRAAEPGIPAPPPAAAQTPSRFWIGADISWIQQQEDDGTKFSDRGVQKDILTLLKDRGFNAIRLRLFHNPSANNGYSSKGYCDLPHTLTMAKRIKAAGMYFLLDFHYSDDWAGPNHQTKPAAWERLHGDALKTAVHDYTRDVLTALQKQNSAPEMVQIGNEINNGLLWPDGNRWQKEQPDFFYDLLKAGAAGAKEADPAVKIMLHLAYGGQNKQSREFFDRALARGVQFDVIGESYYPQWHGTPAELQANLTDLAARYSQSVMVVEYSLPNIRQINDIVHNLPGGKGLGTCYWEPTNRHGPALIDANGATKPEMDAYPTMTRDYAGSAP